MPSSPDDKRERDRRYNANRPAWVSWYKLKAWRARSKQQLAAEPWCRMCVAKNKRTKATIADHIKPHRGVWLSFIAGALQSLCWPCHSGPKQRQERADLKGACDANGMPVDPSHPWSD